MFSYTQHKQRTPELTELCRATFTCKLPLIPILYVNLLNQCMDRAYRLHPLVHSSQMHLFQIRVALTVCLCVCMCVCTRVRACTCVQTSPIWSASTRSQSNKVTQERPPSFWRRWKLTQTSQQWGTRHFSPRFRCHSFVSRRVDVSLSVSEDAESRRFKKRRPSRSEFRSCRTLCYNKMTLVMLSPFPSIFFEIPFNFVRFQKVSF